jgi:predicted MFS family arabinose efflux permease
MFSRLGLLRDHDYRQLFASTTVSQFGFHITLLAIPLVAIKALGATPLQVGLLSTMSFAPFLLVGLPAGAWVDRMRRQRVLIVGDLGRAAVLVTVPLAWWAGVLTIWQLYVVVFVFGIFTVFFDVAYQSYLPHLVGRTNLVEGNAKLESMRALAQVGGPALAGQLIRVLTAPVALLVDAIAMAVSALFITRIRRQEEKPQRNPDAHLVREVLEGLQFVLGHRLLRAIALCTSTFNFFFAAYLAMTILFLERVLGLGAGAIGLVFTIGGLGGVVGAATARRFAALVGQGPAIWLSLVVSVPFALMLPLFAEPGWRLWVSAAGFSLVSAGGVIYNITQVSFRQGLTPDHLLGRMNATMRFLVWGTLPLGGLLGGLLGESFGIRSAMLVGAVGSSLAFLAVFLSPLRGMRTLPTEPAPGADSEATPAGAR